MFNTKDSLESRETAEKTQRRIRINLLAGGIHAWRATGGGPRRRIRRRRIGLRISHRQPAARRRR